MNGRLIRSASMIVVGGLALGLAAGCASKGMSKTGSGDVVADRQRVMKSVGAFHILKLVDKRSIAEAQAAETVQQTHVRHILIKVTPTMSAADAQACNFVISAPYSRWKQVATKELDATKGILQGKLKLKGDLPTIVRYTKASQEMTECTTRVPVEWPDEK